MSFKSGTLHTPVRAPRSQELPRLLYVGEVDVQAFCHGSLLLYRLLQTYPRDRLRILETSPGGSQKERRIQGATYEHLPFPARPLFHNRYARRYAGLLPHLARLFGRDLCERMREPSWDALITVAHGQSWIPAFDAAVRAGRPAHLVIHDDWPRYSARGDIMQRLLDVEFANRYMTAASRLCVSPHMEAEYRRRYNSPGHVLYPARSENVHPAESPPRARSGLLKAPVIAYAGTIATQGQGQLLGLCARALEPLGGRVVVFGPVSDSDLHRHGVAEPGIECRGLIPSHRVVEELRGEADVLLLPMSFDPADGEMIRINFPSKLTDYTATGLPILICAPEHSSAALWEKEFPGAAAVVTTPEETALRTALDRICKDPEHRYSLALLAIEAGRKCFDPARAAQVFHDALSPS